MADLVNTENAETVDDATQAQSAFEGGFLDNAAPLPGAAAKVEAEPIVEAKADPKPEAEAPVEVKAEEPPAPEYVQITKEQFETLMASATKTGTIEGQLSKVFGTVGDVQQIVKKLQAATPVGQQIKLPKGAFAKVRKDFPELADLLESDFADALGTGASPVETPTVVAPVATDPEAISSAVRTQAIRHELEALDDAHPKWREITGAVSRPEDVDPNHPFRQWLAKQPVEYQKQLNSTNSYAVISRAIDKFHAVTAKPVTPVKPAPKVVVRQDRIRSAVTPKGDGGQAAPAKTVDDAFREGYASG